MSFSTPTLGLPETLTLARTLGYAGFEPRVGRRHGHRIELERTPAERRGMAKRIAESGVAICALATGIRYSDPRRSEAAVEETLRHIELAAELGSSRLRVFGGPLPEGIAREAATDALCHSLGRAAPAARDAGVTLCLETHDAWTDPSLVAEVMRRVDHPHVAVNWDVMHPRRTSGVSVPDAFAILRPWIAHTHIHDGMLAEPLVMKRCGEGEIDLAAFFSLLHGIGYSGYVSGEWPDCEAIIDLGDELARMRSLETAAQTGKLAFS